MKNSKLVLVSILSISLASSFAEAAEPLALQKVMKELGQNMQIITGAIALEDWALVAKTAPMIAEHAQPPVAEKMRIMLFMGGDMPRFKAIDGETHEAADELMNAAKEKNGQKVISAFQKVQTACLNCHQAYRAKFTVHFYGN
jgi:cytochrome c556